jgi:hypothetical protein
MKTKWFLAAMIILCSVWTGAVLGESDWEKRDLPYVVDAPKVYRNMAVYLIRGPTQGPLREYMTLEEALRLKLAVVHETGRVSGLFIENLSKDKTVSVMAGDIVKGGKQDRALAVDLLIAPLSGKVKVRSFCVERGRWSRRGDEKVHRFEKSMFMLATSELKLAARWSANQRQVWAAVGRLQALLKKRVQAEVRDRRSRCSLQLTLEQPTVQSILQGYVGAFQNLPQGRKHAIGFAMAVNGEFAGAELFDSAHLFKKVWPKLLMSSCIDGLARCENKDVAKHPDPDAILKRILSAEAAVMQSQTVSAGTCLIIRETRKDLIFDSRQCPSAAPKATPHSRPCPAPSPHRPGTGHHPTPCPPPPSPSPPSGSTPSSPDTGRRSVVPK